MRSFVTFFCTASFNVAKLNKKGLQYPTTWPYIVAHKTINDPETGNPREMMLEEEIKLAYGQNWKAKEDLTSFVELELIIAALNMHNFLIKSNEVYKNEITAMKCYKILNKHFIQPGITQN